MVAVPGPRRNQPMGDADGPPSPPGGPIDATADVTTVTLGVMSVICVFGVGLNSLCLLCIWGPQNRSTAVVYFGVFGPPTLCI